jgi:hypothetical protein
MPLKRIIFIAGLALAEFFSIACAQVNESARQNFQQAAVNREYQLWQSFNGSHFNTKTFEPWLANDFLSIDGSGKVVSKEETLQMLGTCSFSSHQITEPQARSLSSTSYVFIYKVSITGSCNNHAPHTGMDLVSDTWKKHDGKWVIQLHTETVVPVNK